MSASDVWRERGACLRPRLQDRVMDRSFVCSLFHLRRRFPSAAELAAFLPRVLVVFVTDFVFLDFLRGTLWMAEMAVSGCEGFEGAVPPSPPSVWSSANIEGDGLEDKRSGSLGT